jgi:hypothetical protein
MAASWDERPAARKAVTKAGRWVVWMVGELVALMVGSSVETKAALKDYQMVVGLVDEWAELLVASMAAQRAVLSVGWKAVSSAGQTAAKTARTKADTKAARKAAQTAVESAEWWGAMTEFSKGAKLDLRWVVLMAAKLVDCWALTKDNYLVVRSVEK